MSKNKKILIIATIIILAIGTVMAIYIKPKKIKNSDKLNIVTTTFSSYDFARQIVGDKAEVIFLLGPGVDSHSYEPSVKDLATIKNADIFIYIGGEMEQWVDKILETDTINTDKTTLIHVTECIETIEEQEVDGAEEEHHHHDEVENEDEDEHDEDHEEEHGSRAFDEHIWTSPSNAIKMVKYLSEQFCNLDNENKDIYQKNAEDYIKQIEDVRNKIQEIVANKKRDRLVFGDKMPMQYFLNEFGLTASAAFNGCSTEAEPGTKTITYLVNKVKEENIPVVLYIELSTGKTAKSIANETEAKTMQIQTLHNISKDDFKNGETYVSLMARNLPVLKEALQ